MFSASVIVFRESLEAALLIGIIAAATRGLSQRDRWLAVGIIAGLAGSLIVAALTEKLAQLADGAGSEMFNATVLGIAVLMLAWHNIWMASHGREMASQAKRLGQSVRGGTQELSAVSIAVALAVLREGSETVLFLYGIASGGEASAVTLLTGGVVGLAGGILAGVAIYFGLLRIPTRWLFSATSALILVLAAGLASQMARFLIQADLLPSLASPLWDSSAILPGSSAFGSMLHILIGYDARPTGMQVAFYAGTLLFIAGGAAWVRKQKNLSTHKLGAA